MGRAYSRPVAKHPNAELLERFYAAFDARDGAAMAACYSSMAGERPAG